MKNGKIVQVMGPVVDVEFGDNDLPMIKDALTVQNGEKKMRDGGCAAYRKQYGPLYHAVSQRGTSQGYGSYSDRRRHFRAGGR